MKLIIEVEVVDLKIADKIVEVVEAFKLPYSFTVQRENKTVPTVWVNTTSFKGKGSTVNGSWVGPEKIRLIKLKRELSGIGLTQAKTWSELGGWQMLCPADKITTGQILDIVLWGYDTEIRNT